MPADARRLSVEPLPWTAHPEDGSICREGLTGRIYRLRALHPFGAYFILEDDLEDDVAGARSFHLARSGDRANTSVFPSEEAARQAAQDEFDQAILSVVKTS